MSTITPNMNLVSPVPGQTDGPEWANDLVTDLDAIDSHDHTSGKGVPITPNGLDINADLSMASNNLIDVRTVRFDPQTVVTTASADIGCLYEVVNDLYYRDGAGNNVRMTQGGSVSGSAGTITGLPSGTASASFAGGTFTFESATNTPAAMDVGPVTIGNASVGSKTITISPNVAIAADYSLALPAALPASTSVLSLDNVGNVATIATVGTGSVVLAPSAIIGATFSPTIVWTGGNNPTINASQYYYTRVSSSVQTYIYLDITGHAGTGSQFNSTTIPVVTSVLKVIGFAYVYTAGAISPGPVSLFTLENSGSTLAFPSDSISVGSGVNKILIVTFSYLIV